MSSKYQSEAIFIPEGFPALLKAFTREVLRAQPSDVYEFGARYFSDLAAARGGGGGDQGGGGGDSGGAVAPQPEQRQPEQ